MKKEFYVFFLIWIFLLIFLPWKGFYVLNDSYVYEWNVRHFFENNFLLHPLTSPTMLFQTTLGSFIYLFYKDPGLLRLLTSIFYFSGSLGLFRILIKVSKNKSLALTTVLLLMFNPLYLNLGFTFMSDVYYLSTFIFSSFFFYLYLTDNSLQDLVITSVLLSFLFLERQTGIIVTTSFIVLSWFYKKPFKHLLVFLLPVLVFIWYQLFYPKPIAYTYQSITVTLNNLKDIKYIQLVINRLIKTFYYIGFFTFPFTLGYLLKVLYKRDINKKFLMYFSTFFLIFTSLALYFWITEKTLMFYIPNILSYAGFTPQNLGFGIKQTLFVNSPVRVRAFITLISTVSISVFISSLVHNFSKIKMYNFKDPNILIILGVPSFLSLGLSMVFRDYFDRYLLVILPFILVLSYLTYKKYKELYKYILIFLVPLIIVSISFEHDYLSFNKVAWYYPRIEGFSAKEFKSTFEYNSYYNLDKIEDTQDTRIFNRDNWVPDIDSYKYYLSYTGVYGYCEIERLHYFSLISPNFKGELQVLVPCPPKL